MFCKLKFHKMLRDNQCLCCFCVCIVYSTLYAVLLIIHMGHKAAAVITLKFTWNFKYISFWIDRVHLLSNKIITFCDYSKRKLKKKFLRFSFKIKNMYSHQFIEILHLVHFSVDFNFWKNLNHVNVIYHIIRILIVSVC